MSSLSAPGGAGTDDRPAGDRLPHCAILASAGSGKTYQLASRYLRLLAMGAEPASILASTFTRAAAAEIRDRVLSWLAEAVDDVEKREELRLAIGAPSLQRGQVIAILRRLTQHLHRLQIRTLDSFFAAVVRSFAMELQLPIEADLIEDDRAQSLRGEAIRLMLDERQPEALIGLLRLLTRGGSERCVTETIDRVISELFELSREAPGEAWECVPEVSGGLGRTEVVACIEHLATCVVTGSSRAAEAHAKSIEAARRHDWEAFIKNGIGRPLSRGESKYSGWRIEPEIAEAYAPLVRHAIATLIARWQGQTLATRDLLDIYGRQYDVVRARENAMTFADLTAAVASAERFGALNDICFRLDATVRHLLMDEFQDTSLLQWRGLEPIAREIVSHAPPERTFFSVGDVKQSIYGWRQAAPEVLDELPALLVGPNGRRAIQTISLARSWRSSPVVIDAVNAVFTSLGTNAALRDFAMAASTWQNGFHIHQPVEKNRQLTGRVELRVVTRPPAPSASASEAVKPEVHRLRQAAQLARDLHVQAPSRSIMILTRTNRAVARLLYELGPSRLNIGASAPGRGGGPLTDAPAVNAVLDLLHFADHPADTVAAFNVANSPLGQVVGLSRTALGALGADGSRSEGSLASDRLPVARSVRRSIMTEGLAAYCAELALQLAPACDAREQRRLMHLVQLAARFEQRRRGRAGDFIRMVETIAVADSQPAAIEVMTVHQAKGLEADIVILPDLEGKLTGAGVPSVVFERDGETGPITRICRYANATVRAFAPELQPLFDRQVNRAVRESLSVLYVAMTRARQGLYMLIDPPKENEQSIPKTAAGVLRCALAKAVCEPGTTVYAHGDLGWLTEPCAPPQDAVSMLLWAAATTEVPPADRARITLAKGAPGIARAALRRTAASARDESIDLDLGRMVPADDSRENGTAIHAMLETVTWLEDWHLDRKTLEALALRTAPRRGQAWATHCAERFLELIDKPVVRDMLSRRRRPADSLRVWRELPFARFVDGSLRSGVIDRLEATYDGGQAIGGTAIDFKTDDVSPNDLAARTEVYRDQLAAYRTAAAEWLGLAESQIRTLVLFLACDEAVEVGP